MTQGCQTFEHSLWVIKEQEDGQKEWSGEKLQKFELSDVLELKSYESSSLRN